MIEVEIVDRDEQGHDTLTIGHFSFNRDTGLVDSFDLKRSQPEEPGSGFAGVEYRLRRIENEDYAPFVERHFSSEDLKLD